MLSERDSRINGYTRTHKNASGESSPGLFVLAKTKFISLKIELHTLRPR